MLRKQIVLGELEVMVLNVLWSRGPSTAREVLEGLPAEESRHYNTVSTVLGRLARRDIVARDGRDRIHVFRARITRDALASEYLGLVREELCGGSWDRLLAALLTHRRPDAKELEKLKTSIADLEEESRDG